MDYLDSVKLKIEIFISQQKVRIHTQMGHIYDLFYESKVEIRELVRVYIH